MPVNKPVTPPPYAVGQAASAQEIAVKKDSVESFRLGENESTVQHNFSVERQVADPLLPDTSFELNGRIGRRAVGGR